MTTVYLIRHAEAEGNAYRRIHGQYDSLVTPNGLRQIAALQARFREIPIDRCYASDLYRTRKTAEAVCAPKGLQLSCDARFREVGLGRWEDVPFGYLEEFEAEDMRRFNREPESWHVDGSERYEVYKDRFLQALSERAEENPGGSIAIVTHGCVLRAAQGVLCPGEKIPYCDNTAVSRLRYDAGRFTVDFLNDSTHLPEEISTFARQRWWRTTETRKDHNLWFTGPDSSGTYHALLGRNPAGFVRVSGGEDGGAGILEAMELLQEHRGQDLGQQLLGMAVSHFRARGVQELTAPKPLEQAAEGFLLRCGFCRDEAGGLTRRIAVPKL